MPKQNPKPRSLRAQAFEESNYPAAVGLRCVEVQIPDDDAYAVQLAGLVALATKQFNYQNKDEAQAAIVAGLWRDAYVATDWEGCMTCEDVADCIENDEGTQEAISNVINTNEQIQNSLNNVFNQFTTQGQQLPASLDQLNVAPTNPADCDFDQLYGSIANIVREMNRRNINLFEQIEAVTNNQEAANILIGAIPIFETLPVDEFFAMADNLRAWIVNAYNAGYTVNLENEYICDLFCLARVGCAITSEIVRQYFENRAVLISGWADAFDTALTIISAYANWSPVSGAIVVNAIMASQAGFAGFLNSWFGITFGEWRLNAAVGEPSDDWMALCTDCPEIPNISLRDTYPGVIVGDPVFLANTMTGGSIWEATYSDQGGGSFAVAVTPQIGGVDVCCILVSASPVNNYQHFPCAGGVVSGAGSGAGSTEYSDLGFYYSSAATITIEIEPVP